MPGSAPRAIGRTGAQAVSEVLGEIHARIAAHFALEEKIMREAHYDRFEAHKEDHEHLLDEIRDIMDAYEDRAEFDAGGLRRPARRLVHGALQVRGRPAARIFALMRGELRFRRRITRKRGGSPINPLYRHTRRRFI